MTSILIVRLGAMGDIVHAIPFAAALRAAMPDARIDWLVDVKHRDLLDLVPVVNHRIAISTRGLSGSVARRQFLATVRELRGARYDLVFDLQGLVKSAVLARLAGGHETVGFAPAHLRERAAWIFYSKTHDTGGAVHVVRKNLAMLGAIGLADADIRFPLTVPASPVAEAIRARLGRGPGRQFVVINPGAAWPNKQWPPRCFGAVAAGLHASHGLRTLVLWGPGEQPLAQAVVESAAGAAEVAPPTGITDLVALAKAASLVISGDTGPLHVAAAVGTPIVALFGPTRPERNGPTAVNDLVLSRAGECECLYERRCRRPRPCIFDIAVHDVLDAADRRLTTPGVASRC